VSLNLNSTKFWRSVLGEGVMYVTVGEFKRLMEQEDAERKKRMAERERQLQIEARKERIRKKFRSRLTIQKEEPEINPDAIYSAGEPLNSADLDDCSVLVSARKRRKPSKVNLGVNPETSDPDTPQRLIQMATGNFLLVDTEEKQVTFGQTYGT